MEGGSEEGAGLCVRRTAREEEISLQDPRVLTVVHVLWRSSIAVHEVEGEEGEDSGLGWEVEEMSEVGESVSGRDAMVAATGRAGE